MIFGKKGKLKVNSQYRYNGLIDDEQKFYEYFRMSKYSFNVLHGKIENRIKKKVTHWRKPIPSKERLAVCLR